MVPKSVGAADCAIANGLETSDNIAMDTRCVNTLGWKETDFFIREIYLIVRVLSLVFEVSPWFRGDLQFRAKLRM